MTAYAQRTNGATDGDRKETKAYLVGGGIASLASAAYLLRDGHIPGEHIHIFEESDLIGGSLDAHGSAEKGYFMRGGRMFDEEAYTCTYDLLSFIPSLNDPKKSVKEEMFEFNKHIKSHSKSRLVKNGEKVDVSSMGFSLRDRVDLIKLLALPEDSIGTRRIEDYFEPSFFTTNFWFMWCTTFAFQPWHSAIEFKRYLLRFIQEFPRISTLTGVRRTPYNQYDAIVVPLVAWLQGQGVHFEMNSQVTHLDLKPGEHEKTVERLHYMRDGKQHEIVITKEDYVFVTLGSMTAGSSFGSMTSAPRLESKQSGGSWMLWETLAKDQPDFGRPSVFDDHIDESKWESFTVTFRDPTFFTLMENFTGNKAGTGGLVTLTDSNWLMSVVLYHQPHFLNQPENVYVSHISHLILGMQVTSRILLQSSLNLYFRKALDKPFRISTAECGTSARVTAYSQRRRGTMSRKRCPNVQVKKYSRNSVPISDSQKNCHSSSRPRPVFRA